MPCCFVTPLIWTFLTFTCLLPCGGASPGAWNPFGFHPGLVVASARTSGASYCAILAAFPERAVANIFALPPPGGGGGGAEELTGMSSGISGAGGAFRGRPRGFFGG